ncbi:MAG: hypothetical protein PQJ61_17405 [Spirochaetales bacterium]|uniref:Uncharacterized protein n=1 Tax=Candidatus Thalassospirochaeta sargassi TaxID=3119039 RepID=A0AAJ1ML62_9SPIO|nr:hypothetical protein [Spirochaetales bacterium]
MGKISAQAKEQYTEKLKEFKSVLEEHRQKESDLNAELRNDRDRIGLLSIEAADVNLNIVSYLVLMNNLSVALLGIKNDAYLNEARKTCYKSIINLENAVSNYIDVPFSEYEGKLEKIKSIDQAARWKLVCKLGFSISSVKDAFGENTKWKWSFVEIEGRFAVVAKNLLDLKTLMAGLDPRADFYQERFAHLKLVKRLLQNSADGYREKYELSTLRIDDFKLAINYLGGLRRLNALVGEPEEANDLKKKIDIWKSKMDQDIKKKES